MHDNALWLSDVNQGSIQRCAFAADDALAPCSVALAVPATGSSAGLAGIALP